MQEIKRELKYITFIRNKVRHFHKRNMVKVRNRFLVYENTGLIILQYNIKHNTVCLSQQKEL